MISTLRKNTLLLFATACLSLLVIGFYLPVKAQSTGKEAGIPIQKDFLPIDYKASGQNFAITTDKRGLVYVANFAGVLEFDGTAWRTILTKEISKVNTLVTDKSGRVYVGARGEIGYLESDSIGNMRFISLNKHLAKYHIAFPDVISSYSTPKGIYFITGNYILRWTGEALQAWKSNSTIINAFYVNDALYVQQNTGGLQLFDNGRFSALSGGNQFSQQVTVNAMAAAGKENALIGSGNQGLFSMNSSGIVPFRTGADAYLKSHIISCSAVLSDGSYVFGTVNGGIVNLAPDGTVKQIYSKATTGLNDNRIHALYEDDNHGLWVATDNGITRIEIPSYLLFYNARKNVNGNVVGITRFKGQLYIATDLGLFRYNTGASRFDAVVSMQQPCFSLLKYDDRLLIATNSGVFSFDGNHATNLMQGYALTLYRSQSQPDKVYVGRLNGAGVIRFGNGGVSSALLPGVTDEVREIGDEKDGALWLQVPSKGVIRYNIDTHSQVSYSRTNGLPYNSGNHINIVDGQVLFGTIKGVFRFDNGHFVHVNLFKADSAVNYNWVNKLVKGRGNDLWITAGSGNEISLYKRNAEGAYTHAGSVLAELRDQQIFSIYPDDNGSGVWFGGADNLVFFDTQSVVSTSAIKPALIRSVKINADSLIYNGTYTEQHQSIARNQKVKLKARLTYKENDISFTFSSPSATGNSDMLYKYYLEGYGADTSSWVREVKKEYSNLPAGDYTFHVKARNIFGAESPESTYSFSISKPFYQTWFAYILYIAGLGIIIYLLIRWRSQRLLKEKSRLEKTIQDRTAEVVSQKEAIEEQTKELASKNDELEKINQIVKSINSEINFGNLMQSILEKAKLIRGAEKAAMLVYDKPSDSFKFKASYGYNTGVLEQVQLTLEDAEIRYLSAAEEIYEDIYFIKSIKSTRQDDELASVNKAKSSLMMVIKVNGKIQAFMIMENWQKRNAFAERDFSLIRNLKEHFVAAMIKTILLEDIQNTLTHLKETQEQLIRHEKMASIGQLSKGIVDRILNPLNYINNFSSLSKNLIDESIEVIEKPEMSQDDHDDVMDILETVKSNMQKVNEHGTSATRIIKSMEKILHEKSTHFMETDLNTLVESISQQVSHEAQKEFPEVKSGVKLNLDPKHEKVKLLPAEMSTVMTNMINNSYYAVWEKLKNSPNLIPEIIVSTSFDEDAFEISIKDNGKGITATERKQLFSPFFTTKPTAKGTGLGLYMSQDIVKEHKGVITLSPVESAYTEFIIRIPKKP